MTLTGCFHDSDLAMSRPTDPNWGQGGLGEDYWAQTDTKTYEAKKSNKNQYWLKGKESFDMSVNK